MNISVEEAQDLVERFYDDRLEVREWQNQQCLWLQETNEIRSIAGRVRYCPIASDKDRQRVFKSPKIKNVRPVGGLVGFSIRWWDWYVLLLLDLVHPTNVG